MNLPIIQRQNLAKTDRGQLRFRNWMTPFPGSIFATVMSLSLTIGLGAGGAVSAPTRAAKQKAVKPKAVVSSPVVQSSPAKPAAPEAILPPNRIHNMMLPVPTITERLIRDIMVGKPQEAAPPAGTEAFSNEEGAALNNPATSAQVPQAMPSQSSSDDAQPAPAAAPSAENPQTTPAQSASDSASPTAPPSTESTQAAPARSASDSALPMTSPGTETPQGSPSQSANDIASPIAAPAAEAKSIESAPAGMIPDTVVPLKPELKPTEETEKSQEKSQVPLDESPLTEALTKVDPAEVKPNAPAAFTKAEPESIVPQQCAAPSIHALLGDNSKQPTTASDSPKDSSSELGSAGVTTGAQTRPATQTSLESPRERIPADGLEGATYAVKTNGGFGSAMVSRQSLPIEPAVEQSSGGTASQNPANSEEVELDSATAPATAAQETSEPVTLATPSSELPGNETVMDAASSDDGVTELKSNVNLGLPSGSILGDVDKEIKLK